ncbi:MAG: hypothetical protein FJ398_06135 [Verrucomicrobia bacterium]|nr:hypothetical protein [Verrucomicrobiota bacterium]
MKKAAFYLLLGFISIVAFSGCVAVPPLINVQHREHSSDTQKRLDDIDRRLQRIEQKLDKAEK